MNNSLKAALWTVLFTFIAVFGVGLLGWIVDVAEWASSESGEFPSVTPLGKLAVAALAAGASGLVNFVVRFAQSKGALPGEGPKYVETD